MSPGCWGNASAVTGDSLAAYLARCSGDGACLHRTAPYVAAQSKWQKIWAFPESWPITARFATRRARPERTGGRTRRDGRIAAAEHVITRRRGGCATAAHCFRSYSRPIPAAIRFEHALCIIGFGLKAGVCCGKRRETSFSTQVWHKVRCFRVAILLLINSLPCGGRQTG